ncbi:MAG: LacI family transcriptional regulator, partial [Actinomycetota bacterium]|nr:LacI family transcriptional regulator [Actinomycetota bacterium]
MSGVGLAIPADQVDDHFVAALAHALAGPLVDAGMTLVTRVVGDDEEEERVYRHWAHAGGITGVALLDVCREDPRVPLLRSLGFPLAAVVDVAVAADFPAVVVDFDASISVLRSFLAARPHRRVVYITAAEERASAPSRAAAIETAGADGLFE